MKISEILEALNIKYSAKYAETEVVISTDTRTIKEGDFYLPLKGASFDGEKFIAQALEKGAAGVFYTDENNLAGIKKENNIIFIKVSDTLKTYLELANYWRNKLNPIVIAVTGSSGKTTAKEIISSVMSEHYITFKTPLNHNNEIGFCQTIFEMPEDTQVLVLEMGMRGLGEIELLSKYAEPDISVITNVGTAHIGRLGSRENIAKAKCEIVKHQRGQIFIAHNDALIRNTVDFAGEQLYYSLSDVKILEKHTGYSRFEYKNSVYELNVSGDFNIENSLAAIICAEKSGLSTKEIQEGLKKYHPIEKRWEEVSVNGFKIINDSYNANPESMRAFINTVFELYDNYTIVLGDMGELGENSEKYHRELGEYINNHKNLSPKASIISIGVLSKNITNSVNKCDKKHFDNIDDFLKYIHTKPASILFLKASRSMKFEQIAEGLKSYFVK